MLLTRLQNTISGWLMRDTRPRPANLVSTIGVTIGSHIGLQRKENQDRVIVMRANGPKPYIMVLLCDGMGGMSDGAACASLAAASFLCEYHANSRAPVEPRLKAAAHAANLSVHAKYFGRGGSTLSAVVITAAGCFCSLNIGDSRIYSINGRQFSQLSIDDTLAGHISLGAEAGAHGRELLQFIGMGDGLIPNIIAMPEEEHRITLLTSDGIHLLGEQLLTTIAANAPDPPTFARRLIELSIWYGGRDNASIAIIPSSCRSIDWSGPSESLPSLQLWDTSGELQVSLEDGAGERAGSTEYQRKHVLRKVSKFTKRKEKKNNPKGSWKQAIPAKQAESKEADTVNTEPRKEAGLPQDQPQLNIDFE